MCYSTTTTKITLKYIKSDETAITPKRITTQSIGLDLFTPTSTILLPDHQQKVNTHIRLQIPNTHYGRIETKSGTAYRSGIHVLGGIIDADYRGDIYVILNNASEYAYAIRRGEPIAQLIIQEGCIPDLEEVSELTSTARDTHGLGELDEILYSSEDTPPLRWYHTDI